MKEMTTLFGFFLLLILLIVIGATMDRLQDTQQMKVCVAAGKDWVRTHGDRYDCVTRSGHLN